MALGDDVMNIASQTAQGAGHTVGNAIDAYKIAEQTQNAREELDMKKQENERNKSQWLNSQIVAIGRQPEGAARDLMLKGFSRQLPSVVPGANPDIPELFKRDPEMLRKATEAANLYMHQGNYDPTALNNFFAMQTPEAIDALNKNADHISKIKQAQLMSGIKQGQKDNADFEKLGEKVNNPTSRSTIGRYQMNLDKVETLRKFDTTLGLQPGQHPPKGETYAQKIARYDNANPQDLFEVVKAADQLISNAQSTVYGADHLMPKDIGIAQSQIAQWLSNGSVPANSGAFIAKFMNMAEREGQYYRSAKQKALKGMVSGYSHLEQKDPSRFNAIVGDALVPDGGQGAAPEASGAPAGAGGGPMSFEAWQAAGKPKAGKP